MSTTATAAVPAVVADLRARCPELTFEGSADEITATFPDGTTAILFTDGTWWSVRFPGRDVAALQPTFNAINTLGIACKAWMVEHAPAPVVLDAGSLDAILATVRSLDTVRFTALLRTYLKQRTGRRWSVRKSTGTASLWVHVSTDAKRDMSPMDAALLEVVTGMPTTRQDATISPDARVAAVRNILAGRPV